MLMITDDYKIILRRRVKNVLISCLKAELSTTYRRGKASLRIISLHAADQYIASFYAVLFMLYCRRDAGITTFIRRRKERRYHEHPKIRAQWKKAMEKKKDVF